MSESEIEAVEQDPESDSPSSDLPEAPRIFKNPFRDPGTGENPVRRDPDER
jgi:hypothetical protein